MAWTGIVNLIIGFIVLGVGITVRVGSVIVGHLPEIFVIRRLVMMEVVVGDGAIVGGFVLPWLFSDWLVNYQRPFIGMRLGGLVGIAMIWVQTLTSPGWNIGVPGQIEQSSPSG